MIKLVSAVVVLIIFVWRVKRGFHDGMMKEIVHILSGIISLVCLALIVFAVNSFRMKATNTLVLCIVGLIVLGVIFKICNLIFAPLLLLGNISVIGFFNSIFGAVLGAAEATAIVMILYKVLSYLGIYII